MARTRREFFQQGLILPLALGSRDSDIITEPNCLSEESAAGFRSLKIWHPKMTLLCCASTVGAPLAFRLRERAASGTWLIWESSPFAHKSQARIMRDIFDIKIGAPIPASRLYVRYCWPSVALTRSFSAVVPVECTHEETVALCGNTPVSLKHNIGAGGLIFLGSMLGPHVGAGDPQAHAIATGMLRSFV